MISMRNTGSLSILNNLNQPVFTSAKLVRYPPTMGDPMAEDVVEVVEMEEVVEADTKVEEEEEEAVVAEVVAVDSTLTGTYYLPTLI